VCCIAFGTGCLAFGLVGPSPTPSGAYTVTRPFSPSTLAAPPASSTTLPSQPAVPTSSTTADGGNLVPVPQGDLPSNVVDPSLVATAVVPSLPLYQSPGSPTPEGSMPNPNYLGAKLVVLVTAIQGSWVQAYIPERPNEFTAWVPAADLSMSTVPCHIAIGIGAHKLVLYCNNAPVYEAPVATGALDSPTPTGSFFVAYIVQVTDPGGPYGPYALGTSDFSNTYFSFDGGPGQVGIHGTDQPWVIGSSASHGCVRLNNNDITDLAQQVVPGTPVEISA
jgi:hypothetical protein